MAEELRGVFPGFDGFWRGVSRVSMFVGDFSTRHWLDVQYIEEVCFWPMDHGASGS